MEIRDSIHGSIKIDPLELPVIESPYFQRLRHIKQLGFSDNSFPGATHNRFIHSLGAMETASRMFDAVFQKELNGELNSRTSKSSSAAFRRFRTLLRLAALLHDVGHGPLSHTTEFAMPPVKDLKLPVPIDNPKRKATHEDYTLKIILDSSLTPLIEQIGKHYGFKPLHVASLIEPKLQTKDSFFDEKYSLKPILQQIISSELDADRMDYLRRDSLHAGVSYGQFDFDWLLHGLTKYQHQGNYYLALQHRALYTFEDFLISRYHMFLMIYFHHKSVIYDEMLAHYVNSPESEYVLPSDIEKYCEYNDAHLYSHLAHSKNPWAQRIAQRRPYQMLIELHSGIPATPIARKEQETLLTRIEKQLQSQKIHYIVSTSTSDLSKYFYQPKNPIFVRYDNQYNEPTFIHLEQCTDLFERYQKKRWITRLYVPPEHYAACRKGNLGPLRF